MVESCLAYDRDIFLSSHLQRYHPSRLSSVTVNSNHECRWTPSLGGGKNYQYEVEVDLRSSFSFKGERESGLPMKKKRHLALHTPININKNTPNHYKTLNKIRIKLRNQNKYRGNLNADSANSTRAPHVIEFMSAGTDLENKIKPTKLREIWTKGSFFLCTSGIRFFVEEMMCYISFTAFIQCG